MDHAQNTSRLAVFDGSNTDPVGGLTRVSRVARESGQSLCDHCGRVAPGAEMQRDADPDTESGWVCAEGFGCLTVTAPALRIAGIAVAAADLAPAHRTTPSGHAVSHKAKTERGFSALADAELLVGGAAHITPADVTLSEAGAIRSALRRVVRRLGRGAVETVGTAQTPAAIEAAGADFHAAAKVLARWVSDMKAVRR